MAYIGYSMSVRAAEAYGDGERPLSKWRKEDIIDRIFEVAEENGITLKVSRKDIDKLTLNELKKSF